MMFESVDIELWSLKKCFAAFIAFSKLESQFFGVEYLHGVCIAFVHHFLSLTIVGEDLGNAIGDTFNA